MVRCAIRPCGSKNAVTTSHTSPENARSKTDLRRVQSESRMKRTALDWSVCDLRPSNGKSTTSSRVCDAGEGPRVNAVMKAIAFTEYGSPDGLELGEVPAPIPEDDEVLVRAYAPTVRGY